VLNGKYLPTFRRIVVCCLKVKPSIPQWTAGLLEPEENGTIILWEPSVYLLVNQQWHAGRIAFVINNSKENDFINTICTLSQKSLSQNTGSVRTDLTRSLITSFIRFPSLVHDEILSLSGTFYPNWVYKKPVYTQWGNLGDLHPTTNNRFGTPPFVGCRRVLTQHIFHPLFLYTKRLLVLAVNSQVPCVRAKGISRILFTFNHIFLLYGMGRGLCLWKRHASCFLFVCRCVSLWMSLFAFTYCKLWASWPALTKPFTDLMPLKAIWHLLSTFLHWLTTIWRARDIMNWEVGFRGSDQDKVNTSERF